MHHKYWIGVLMILLGACADNNNQPQIKTTFSLTQPFTTAYAVAYGNFYQDMGINTPVFALDFYTEQLTIDSMGNYQGTGYNLLITDLFAQTTDSILPQGTYVIDSLEYGQPGTIIPGKYIGDFAVGAQITKVGTDIITQHFLTEGTLELKWQQDTAYIIIKMNTEKQDKVDTQFIGKMPCYYIDLQQKDTLSQQKHNQQYVRLLNKKDKNML